MATGFEDDNKSEEQVQTQQKIAGMISLIWNEFFASQQLSADPARQFPTEDNILDSPGEERVSVSPSAKCRLIPLQIKTFCQILSRAIHGKFPHSTEQVVSKFVFDRWLLRELCDEGNKNGLITEQFISEDLFNNLQLLKEALCILNSSDRCFDISVHLFPPTIREVCLSLRCQAKSFTQDFLSETSQQAPASEPKFCPQIEAFMLSWSSLTMIYDFMK